MATVSQDQEPGSVQRLSSERMEQVFGTASPTLQEVRKGMAQLADSIHRGSSLCLPVYEDGQPVSWFFAGYPTD